VPKMREDEIERRIENMARVIDEYQPSFTQSPWLTSADSSGEEEDEYRDYFLQMEQPPKFRFEPDEAQSRIEQRIYIKVIAAQLESKSSYFIRKLLEEIPYWSPSDFEELARISPTASARLNFILAGAFQCEQSEEKTVTEANFKSQVRKIAVEIRRFRPGLLRLPLPELTYSLVSD
jgi:hypothetical protein